MKERAVNLRQGSSAAKEAAIFGEPASRAEAYSPLRAVPHPASLPLSFAQQRLWFLEQLSPGHALNNLPLIFRLHGTLRRDALRESLNELVRRHEVLRTTIRLEGEQPVQVIAPALALELPCWEVSQTGTDLEAEVRQYVSREGGRPFDLEREPLVRASLLRLSASEHILLLVIHHILCDGWSFNILHQELSQLYAAFSAGGTSPLAPLPLQYADYTLWQRQEIQGDRLERELSYWQSRLQDVPVLALPTDRPRSQESQVRGAQLRFTLPSDLTRSLRELSRLEGGSLFQALLAAFQVVLSQYSGLTDIAVGTPAANRTQPATEGLVGCFINMLVMRTNLAGNPSWREVLAQVRRVAQEGKARQDLPFEKLVERLRLERHAGQHPLYQVIITLRHRALASFEAGDLRIDLPELGPTQATQGELALAFDVEGEQVQGTLDYAVDLFHEETMQRLVGHLHTALAAMVAHPEQRLSEVSLLTADERRRLVVEWNATQCLYPREQCIHERFEEQARRTPDAVALVCGEQPLTYERLNRRANQVAHLLRAHGVGPEVLVGLSVERSLEMVVGMLGILKAGGAYVPMDPTLPAARLVYLLKETRVKVGLTQRRVRERLPEASLTWLLLDPEEESLTQQPGETPVSGVCSANLAYVLFTSGSTGQPKGVQLAHSGVSNLVTWWQRFAALSPHDRVTQFASMGFDVSVWEIWSVLCSGGRLSIIEESQFMAPSQLYQYIKQEGITVSWLPTPLAELMLQEPWSEPTSFRMLFTSGEQLRAFPERHLPFVFINTYGPTETTVTATAEAVKLRDEAGAFQLPGLGGPISNMQIYVLNADMQPVPWGVVGELYIGGDGLARGYLHRAALTAERFVPNPFSQQPGERLYRTGDLVRALPDGDLEFVGRSDQQVKVRGYRIELGEIEATLGQHPAVQQAVVTTHTDPEGNKRLVAYVVPAPAGRDDSLPEQPADQLPAYLRQVLQEQIPAYMVPWQIIILDAFPLTPSGKVNRKALPAPQQMLVREETTRVSPRTRIEKALVEIWSDLLNLEPGIHENFFTLGGDSLLVMRMVARAHHQGIHCTPRQVMMYQTVAELASAIEQHGATSAQSGVEDLVTGPVALTQFQAWLLQDREWVNANWWNVAFFCQPRHSLERELLRETVKQLRRYHDGLRTHFTQEGDKTWKAWIAEPDDTVPVEWLSLAELSREEQQTTIQTHIARLQASLDLIGGRCMQITYFQCEPQQPDSLFFLFHHAVLDAYSLPIVLHDFQAIYQSLQRRDPISLPPKTTSLQALGEHFSRYVSSPLLQQELAERWLTLPWHEMASLPVDFPERKEDNTFGSLQILTRTLSQEETTRLLLKGKERDTTMLEMLVLAVLRALSVWIASRPIVLGLIDHGRESLFDEMDLSNTVSSLIGVLWYPLRLPQTDTLDEALSAVKHQMREMPNRGSTYALLRLLSDEPETRARLRALPHHEVEFNYLSRLDPLDEEPLLALPERVPAEVDWWESSEEKNSYLISFTPFFIKGQLNIECRYSENLYRQETIEALVQRFMETLWQMMS